MSNRWTMKDIEATGLGFDVSRGTLKKIKKHQNTKTLKRMGLIVRRKQTIILN